MMQDMRELFRNAAQMEAAGQLTGGAEWAFPDSRKQKREHRQINLGYG